MTLFLSCVAMFLATEWMIISRGLFNNDDDKDGLPCKTLEARHNILQL